MSTMTLQLPQTYVNVENEEMEYVDGGVSIPDWAAATAIDAGLLAAGVGVEFAPLKFLGREAGEAFVKKVLPKLSGVISWVVKKAVGGSVSFSTSKILSFISSVPSSLFSAGGIIAYGIDVGQDGHYDGKINI